MKRPPLCSSCYRSERTEPAAFAVVGMIDNRRPYRANLCAEHLEDMETNGGLMVRSCRRLSPPTVTELRDAYTRTCATEPLSPAGFARMDKARAAWVTAIIDSGAN